MATWEDGPEYAPLERPEQFAGPDVAPLSVAGPVLDRSAGLPLDQPRFDLPPVPVPPLEALSPATGTEHRDPQTPYDVASATMTPEPPTPLGLPGTAPLGPNGPAVSGGAWGAAHWSGPPAGNGWPAPQGAPVPSSFPAPGTAQWFGPGPSSPAPGVVDQRAVTAAITPGVLITLGIGVFFVTAPVTFVVAFVLTSRMTAARQLVRRIYGAAVGLLGFVALILTVGNLADGSFGAWWRALSGWAFGLSLVMAVVIVATVRRELLRRGTPPPYQPQPYGGGPYDQPPGPGQQPPWQ